MKNSLVLGGLTSSAGIFLTKVIGILYVIPFSALATESNLSYYARAYSVYEIVLNVSIAGLPYAIATLVAKYHLKKQYKTVLLVRKLSKSILALMGFIMMLVLIALSLPIAQISIGTSTFSIEVQRTRNVMLIMSLAVFTVPLLSSYRGFYQGLKEMSIYASSQVIEQIARVLFLLGLGFLLVVVFGYDPIWAVYAAILSTSVAALISIVQFVLRDRKVMSELIEKSKETEEEVVETKDLLIELYGFAIPFLLNVMLNSMANFVNLLFFNQALIQHGESIQSADLYYSMVMFTTNKLTSIPQVVAPGFISAIIPYVTTSFEKKDFDAMRKHILESLLVVFYLSLPLTYFLFGIAAPIYYVMYGDTHLALGSEVLKLNSITGLSFNLAAVSNALMMALRLRKQNLTIIFVSVLIASITFIPLLTWIGYSGSILSKFLTHMMMFAINMSLLKKYYGVKYYALIKPVVIMLFGLGLMQLSFILLEQIGLSVINQNRVFATLQLGVYGFVGLSVYLSFTYFYHLPQDILHLDLSRLKKKLFHAS